MKVHGKAILAVSILANLALAYLYVDGRRPMNIPETPQQSGTQAKSTTPAMAPASAARPTRAIAETQTPSNVPETEMSVAKRAYAVLQDLKIPTAAINHMLAGYFEWKLAPPTRTYEYWKPAALREAGARLESFQIEQATRRAFISLLGQHAIDNPDLAFVFQPYREKFPFLTAAKQLELQRLSADLDQMLLSSGVSPVEAQAAVTRARQEMTAAVRRLLTDEEFAQYELRESQPARLLANSGPNFTQAEFDALYPSVSKDTVPAIRRDATSLDNARTVLGEQRFREYRRSQDPMYHLLSAVVMRQGSPSADLNTAYELAYQNREQVKALERAGPILSAENARQKASLDAELKEKMPALIGSEAADIFLRSLNANRGIMSARGF